MLLGTVSVDQQKAPSTTIYGSPTITWQTLGNFTINGSTLHVVLNNNANGNVQADMVRLVPISPTAVAAMVTSRDARQRSADAVIASQQRDNESAFELLHRLRLGRDFLHALVRSRRR